MKQYNIYAGINSKDYQFTSLCKDDYDAYNTAYTAAVAIYNESLKLDKIIAKYRMENDVESLSVQDIENIEDSINDDMEEKITYKAILTEEDNRDDLILDYIGDNSSTTDC